MSCCQCVKIKVLDSLIGVLPEWLDNGALYVDLTASFKLEFSKALAEMNDVYKIGDEAALKVSFPATDKNKVIFREVWNHNLVNPSYTPLNVLVFEGAATHNLTSLQVTGFSDANASFEGELKRSKSHWVEAAGDLTLNNIEIATVDFTEAALRANWAANNQYSDGDDGVYFPLIHYGGWISEATILVEDFRPWVHLLKILQEGFCSLGWDFRCPWLETDEGRKLGVYPYGSDYGKQGFLVETKGFRASVDDWATYPILLGAAPQFRVPFTVEDYDPGDNYNETFGYTMFFGGFCIADFITSVTCEIITNDDDGYRVQVAICKTEADENLQILAAETLEGTSTEAVILNFDLIAENVATYVDQEVFVLIAPSRGVVKNLQGFFTNRPIRKIFQKGEQIEVGSLMDSTKTLLDVFKATVHLCNGKIKTDWLNRQVWLYTPYEVDYYGNTLEGFYLDTIESLTQYIEPNTEEANLERLSYNRFVRLAFKRGKDKYIDKYKLESDAPLYSKFLDFGEDVKVKELKENRNPLFVPTVNAEISKFPFIPPELSTVNVDIPHCWDNDDGRVSYDIGFRLLYFYGYVKTSQLDPPGFSGVRRWRFESVTSSEQEYPYSFQVPQSRERSGFDDVDILERIVYGEDENENDFYNLGYRQEYNRRKTFVKSSFLARLPGTLYRSIDFRNMFSIFYPSTGRTFTGRLLRIDGKQTCSDAPATIIFRPEHFAENTCGDDLTVVGSGCENYPGIDVSIDLKVTGASATPNNDNINSPILTDTWYYSTDGGETWLSYTPGTFINVNTPNQGLKFKRVVTFSDLCPPVVIVETAFFAAQCENFAEISPSIMLGGGTNNQASATAGNDSFRSDVSSDTWLVSIDGAAFIAYTPGTVLTGWTTLLFERTVEFDGACEPVVVTAYIDSANPETTDPDPVNDCDNAPEIILTEVIEGSCAYIPSIGGTSQSAICAVHWEVSRDGGTTWLSWDRQPIQSKPGTWVRTTLHFCDNCPNLHLLKECPF